MKSSNTNSSFLSIILGFTFLLCVLWSCTNSEENHTTSSNEIDTTTSVEPISDDTSKNSNMVIAQFIQFELGDAPHFIFKDEKGEEWDFFACRDTSYQFANELPVDQANEINQGWSSNEDLQQKWFAIRYIKDVQPMYIDGPEGEVFIITEASKIAD